MMSDKGLSTHEQDADLATQALCLRVATLRKQHQLTLDQLATMSGVSRSMLSQIERGQANPTLAVTFRIAQAFGMTVGDLVDQPQGHKVIELVKGSDPANWFRRDDKCQIKTLSPLRLEKHIEFYQLRLAPGAELSSAAHYHGTRELFTALEGCAVITAGTESLTLEAGDSAHYQADLDHVISNNGDTDLLGYLVVSAPN